LATITCAIILVALVYVLFKRLKRSDWKNKTIQAYSVNDVPYQFSFDTNQLYFSTETYKTELNWDYYKYYSFYKNSIFLFPENNIYEAIYYSKRELGDTEFDRLVSIASAKLSLFKKKHGA
jgi:hypothetical protein